MTAIIENRKVYIDLDEFKAANRKADRIRKRLHKIGIMIDFTIEDALSTWHDCKKVKLI